MRKAGIFIIIVGIGLIVFTIFTSFTKDKVIDTEQIKISKNKLQNLNWYPLVAIATLGIGAVVLGRSS